MIRATEAIRAARALLGTPYSELDCIGLIARVIRTAQGGVPGYKTAGTNTLWCSVESAAKYRDLTWRQEGLRGAKAGMLAFKRAGTDVHHVGLVTGEGTVIHSSSAKGCVAETPLSSREGWDLLAVHRYIGAETETSSVTADAVPPSPKGKALGGRGGGEPKALPSGEREASSPPVAEERGGFTPKGVERSETGEVPFACNTYIVCAEGGLRMRKKPSAKGKYMQMIPDGTRVAALDERDGWIRCKYRGHVGWVCGDYCRLATGND